MHFFASLILCLFSVSVGLCIGVLRSSSLVLPLLSGTGFSAYRLTSNTESRDENVEEVGECVIDEELADKPGTTNGTLFEILQSILLPFLMRCGFLTTDPVVCFPMIFAELPKWKHCGCFFKKHYRHEQVQFTDVFSLADHMQTCSWMYHKLSILRFYGGCGRHDQLLGRRIECSFVLFFEFVNISGKIPCLAAGASLLSFSLFLRYVLKFHSVGTSLMKYFDLYFSKRWSFFSFSDTCLT